MDSEEEESRGFYMLGDGGSNSQARVLLLKRSMGGEGSLDMLKTSLLFFG